VTDEAKICCGRYDRVFPEYLFYGGLSTVLLPSRNRQGTTVLESGKKDQRILRHALPLRVSVLYYLYYSAATVC
jgi:hypothetical protein